MLGAYYVSSVPILIADRHLMSASAKTEKNAECRGVVSSVRYQICANWF